MSELARRIRIAAYVKGLPAKTIAHRAGLTYFTYRHYATGSSAPDRDRLIAIANVLDVTPEWLLDPTPFRLWETIACPNSTAASASPLP